MSKKPIICKLCGGEMEERKCRSVLGFIMKIMISCPKCEIAVYADTLLKARNKARKLMS